MYGVFVSQIIYSKNKEITVCTHPYMRINGSTYVSNTGNGVSHISNVGNVNVGCGFSWGEEDLNSCLSKPANWCKKQWKDWANPSQSIEGTIKKIVVFVPLLLGSIGAAFLKFAGHFFSCSSQEEESLVPSHVKMIVGTNRFAEKTISLGLGCIPTVQFLGSLGPLVIKRGESNSLQIEGEENILDFFSSYKLQDHHLTIGEIAPNLMLKLHRAVYYTLTLASPLEELIVSGSGKVFIPSLNTSTFSCHIKGSGKVTVQEGEVANQIVNISGSGKYQAENLKTEHSKADIHGSGSAMVKAISSLFVSISGRGKCVYFGNPKVTSRGSGRVFRNLV